MSSTTYPFKFKKKDLIGIVSLSMIVRVFAGILMISLITSCGKEDLSLSMEQHDQVVSFMQQAEDWSEVYIDKPLISYGAFAPETKTPQSQVIGTEESRTLINRFITDLNINTDRAMHDWLIDYGILIRDIKVDNIVSADDSYFELLSLEGLDLFSDQCSIEAHAVLQKHAYTKALSYASTTQSVHGPAFDLNNFMTLRGIGSGLYRMHRFIEARNECR